MSTDKKRTPAEMVDAIRNMALEDELAHVEKMTDDELHADVRAHGGDPDAIGERGAAFVARLIAARKASPWQERARARLERAMSAVAGAPKTPALPRAELLALVAAAKKKPRFDGALAAAFRKRKPEEASDEELRSLLDAIAELEAIAEVEGDTPAGGGTAPKGSG